MGNESPIAALNVKLRGLTSMATSQLLAELVPAFVLSSGQAAAVEKVGGVDAARRVRERVPEGQALDFVVLSREVLMVLEAEGCLLAGSRVDLAQSHVAAAVRAGAPQPSIHDENALREAVRAARSLSFSSGPSGDHMLRLFERWGIAAEVAQRTVKAPPGVPVGALVASGEAELGFQQLSELQHLSGIELLGRLPAGTECVTIFSAAVCAASRQPQVTAALLEFLGAAQHENALRRHGMEAVR